MRERLLRKQHNNLSIHRPIPLLRNLVSKHLERQNRASKCLTQNPEKRKQGISHLLQSPSPSSKSDVYKKAWVTSTPSNRGRSSVSDTVKDKLLSFLKQPDIPYCNPG